MGSRMRAGFTLIEMMVAMALTLFLMIILTQCFVLSLDTFANMKGLGDMQMNLRSAMTILQSDLAEDHFEGKRRLSDPDIFTAATPIQAGYFAIRQGSAKTGASAATWYSDEGVDSSNSIPSARAADQALAFTVKRRGNRPGNFFTTSLNYNGAVPFFPKQTPLEQFFSASTAYNMRAQPTRWLGGANALGGPSPALPAPLGGNYSDAIPDLPYATFTVPYQIRTPQSFAAPAPIGFYSSQWAEVYYYLVLTGTTETPNIIPNLAAPATVLGTPIYSLYRAQFVMVPDSTNLNNPVPPATNIALAPTPGALAGVADFQGLSCNPGKNAAGQNIIYFNSPTDAAYLPGPNAIGNRPVGRTIGISPNAPTPFAFPLVPPYTNVDGRLIPQLTAGGVVGGLGSSDTTNNQTLSQGCTELVLPNVLSFQVQILDTALNTQAFGDIPQMAPNPGYFDSALLNNANAGVDASAGNAGYPANVPLSIKGVKVTLRVWDFKTRQTRQASVLQDL